MKVLFDLTWSNYFWSEWKKIEKFEVFRGNFPNPNQNQIWLTWPDPSNKNWPNPSQNFLTQVRSGQPFMAWVWIWKISTKNVNFFNFFLFGSKKISSCRVGKYPGQSRVGLLFRVKSKLGSGQGPSLLQSISSSKRYLTNLFIWKGHLDRFFSTRQGFGFGPHNVIKNHTKINLNISICIHVKSRKYWYESPQFREEKLTEKDNSTSFQFKSFLSLKILLDIFTDKVFTIHS